jgi:CheY-like chemotaxis protein
MVVAAVDDLLFASRLRTTAKPLDVALVFARSPEAILAAVRDHAPRLLIIDLNAGTLAPVETIRALRADPDLPRVPIVAYVAHVDAALIAAAHAAGADRVLARSQFVAHLGQLLQEAT